MIKERVYYNLFDGLRSPGVDLQKLLAEQTIREIELGQKPELEGLLKERDRLQSSTDEKDKKRRGEITAQLAELFGPMYDQVLKAWEKAKEKNLDPQLL